MNCGFGCPKDMLLSFFAVTACWMYVCGFYFHFSMNKVKVKGNLDLNWSEIGSKCHCSLLNTLWFALADVLRDAIKSNIFWLRKVKVSFVCHKGKPWGFVCQHVRHHIAYVNSQWHDCYFLSNFPIPILASIFWKTNTKGYIELCSRKQIPIMYNDWSDTRHHRTCVLSVNYLLSVFVTHISHLT